MERQKVFKNPLTVLGRGFSKDEHGLLIPHWQSAVNAVAAGLLLKHGYYNSVVFSGGHTAGKEHPSESGLMSIHMQKVVPEVLPHKIWLEEKSIDTRENILELVGQGFINPDYFVPLLTVGEQLWRARRLFRNIAHIETAGISSQATIRLHGSAEQKEWLEECEHSDSAIGIEIKEVILGFLSLFDTQGKFLHSYTSRTRHGDEA